MATLKNAEEELEEETVFASEIEAMIDEDKATQEEYYFDDEEEYYSNQPLSKADIYCPKCYNQTLVECLTCNHEVANCTCLFDDIPAGDSHYCGPCGVSFDMDELDMDDWNLIDDKDYDLYDDYLDNPYDSPKLLTPKEKVTLTRGKTTTPNKIYYTTADCTHDDKVLLKEDVFVRATAGRLLRRKDVKVLIPDFGLYADDMWTPYWRNEFIDWDDFGAPSSPKYAFMQILDAYNKAVTGLDVQIGCVGGHGRTGTILACMLVCANPHLDGKEAVDQIRKQYCINAVETRNQTWFVTYFKERLEGKDPSDEPPFPEWDFDDLLFGYQSREPKNAVSSTRPIGHTVSKPNKKIRMVTLDGKEKTKVTEVLVTSKFDPAPPVVNGKAIGERKKGYVWTGIYLSKNLTDKLFEKSGKKRAGCGWVYDPQRVTSKGYAFSSETGEFEKVEGNK